MRSGIKNLLLLPLLLLLSGMTFHVNGQIYDPVEWTFESKATGTNEYELIFEAHIQEGWHMYAMKLPPESFSIPTSFTFNENDGYQLIGDTKEPDPISKFDPAADMKMNYFEEEVKFTQKVRLNKSGKVSVTGEVEFMVCDSTKCLPPEYVEFNFNLAGKKETKTSQQPTQQKQDKETFSDASMAQPSSSQEPMIHDPVNWSYDTKKLNEKEYQLLIKAQIEEGWHLYSQDLPSEDGPVATSITFEKNSNYKLTGKPEEQGELISKYDPNFDMELNYYENEVVFAQSVKLTGKGAMIKGELTFMVCDEEKCLPPEYVDLAFEIGDAQAAAASGSPEAAAKNNNKDNDAKKAAKKSLWTIFLLGFLGGFAALLTPCVFPMIPLTVSFFTKQSKSKGKGLFNAVLYGLSIIFIYVSLGLIITMTFGPDALNAMASNVWFNLAFFIIFVVFAISFLGAFEITLPSSWVNKADSASDKGGLIGIFFMAFTLSLVSFSCTGPIIGTLLVEAAVGGNVLGPTIGMGGFALALALPFALFAAFPGWLNTLPKSGGWLNSVKVVLGLLELALALKFISNVDLAYHWKIITREVFLALWIVIFSLLGFYLLGKIKLSHDSDLPHISIPRILLAIITFSFVVYLIPGMWGAPLKLISGFPPPTFYTEGWSAGQSAGSGGGEAKVIEGVDRSHCPHNLSCFHDYDLALEYAKKTDKPLMVDFTGWSCVNCRKMEDNVWSDPRVLKMLENDFVLVSLYVDDKDRLPEDEQYVSETTGKKVKTLGNKWSDFQTRRFKTNSQPWYVLLDHNEKELVDPVGYTPDIEEYIDYLQQGLNVFEKRNS